MNDQDGRIELLCDPVGQQAGGRILDQDPVRAGCRGSKVAPVDRAAQLLQALPAFESLPGGVGDDALGLRLGRQVAEMRKAPLQPGRPVQVERLVDVTRAQRSAERVPGPG